MAELDASWRKLTKKNVPFECGPEHFGAFDAIKKVISAPILKYYAPSKPVTLKTDASLKGLDAVLLQEGHPSYFVNRSFQPHQKAYVVNELEFFVVAWAIEKFHHFLFSKKVKTDEKPLKNLIAKSLTQMSPKLQHVLMRTLPYDFSSEKYITGSMNQLADCFQDGDNLMTRSSFPLANYMK